MRLCRSIAFQLRMARHSTAPQGRRRHVTSRQNDEACAGMAGRDRSADAGCLTGRSRDDGTDLWCGPETEAH